MSGLCGIVRLDGREVVKQDIRRQTKALTHRGADQIRIACEGIAGFGALLMRVTREDLFDDQPLHQDATGILFASDARIDNREEIAAALSIDVAALRDMPDSALLFAAYLRWGKACTGRLIGDFAFAAYDPRSRTLDLCRDHMGQRHLYFYIGTDFLAFASEPKGLRALPNVPRILPFDQMEKVLTTGSTGKRVERTLTPQDGMAAVPGGTTVTIAADGSFTADRYWEPRADPAHEGHDEAYYIAAYRRVLTEAVECRLRRLTAPPGIMLSGGFDSSGICALAGPVLEAQGRKFVAVSAVMPEGQEAIRNSRAGVEACRRHMPHLDVRYVTRDGHDIFTNMEAGFLSKEAGMSTNRYVNDALHTALRAAGTRMVMDGHGGDYTLNPRGKMFLISLLRQGRLIRFAREFSARRRFLGCSTRRLFGNAILHWVFTGKVRRRRRLQAGLPATGPSMPLAADYARRAEQAARTPRDPRSRRSERFAMWETLDTLQRAASLGGGLGAAAFELEFTQPFHDKRVIELALAIPEDLYVKNGRERHLARMAIGNLYPPELLQRPPGNDHSSPDFMAMANTVRPSTLAEIDRMERAGKLSEYFDFPRMRQMLLRRDSANPDSHDQLSTHLALQTFLWARYVEWFRGDNG